MTQKLYNYRNKAMHHYNQPNKYAFSMAQKNYSVLLQLGTFLLRYKGTLVAAGCALIFTAGITLAMGQGVKVLIDDGFVAGSIEKLNGAALFIVGIAALMAIGTYTRFYLVSWLGERVSADIRQAVFDHLITLHPNYFEENRSGENHVAFNHRHHFICKA